MKSIFKHIVVVRLDMPQNLSEAKYGAGRTRPYADPRWVKRRLQLYTHVTQPSLRAQTCRNFQVMTLCNDGGVAFGEMNIMDNEIVVPINADYNAPMTQGDHRDMVKMKGYLSCAHIIRYWIDTLYERTEITLVTNLDSDDALHPRFIESIQSFARGRNLAQDENKIALDANCVYQYNLQSGAMGKRVKRAFSPFVTTIEKKVTAEAYRHGHSCLHLHRKKVKVPGTFALQTISGNNIFSRRAGNRPATFNLSTFISPENLRKVTYDRK